MYRIIIVDDEPLILAGISSLITWEDHDCTIVGKATNGPAAFELIRENHPDIVITDIRMPVLDGLQMIEKCKKENMHFAFIVLTNLEEFQLVKKALALGASDYLVKIDLNEEALLASLQRARQSCDLLDRQNQHNLYDDLLKDTKGPLAQTSFHHLLLTDGMAQGIPASLAEEYEAPFLLLFSLQPTHIRFEPEAEAYDYHQISKQILEILEGISSRFFRSSVMFEYGPDTYIMVASSAALKSFKDALGEYCQKIMTALKTYFELSAVFGISTVKSSVYDLPSALTEARTALECYYYDSGSCVVFYDGQSPHAGHSRDFNINMFKRELNASVVQNDSEKLRHLFEQILDLFREHEPGREQATSACINIYTYLYSFFESEDEGYQDIFPYTINIAEQLGHFNCLKDILEWLQSFCSKLCRLLDDRKSTRSDKLVEQARQYIREHYREKLTLADVAEYLNISSGHLSNTFKKFTGVTLSDYIADVKIQHAMELIDTHQYLMYEISDMLGFDNPYYFSKVFKKVTGISPRDHENRKQ